MDLMNNKISFGEVLKNPRAAVIFNKLFPEIMNPFLLHQAKKMTLENILKFSNVPDSQEKIAYVIAKLKAI